MAPPLCMAPACTADPEGLIQFSEKTPPPQPLTHTRHHSNSMPHNNSMPLTTSHAEPMFSVASYLNSPSLSDVVLVSEDGQRFFAHRLILCVQSPVFKTMLDSDLWADSHNKEVCDTVS